MIDSDRLGLSKNLCITIFIVLSLLSVFPLWTVQFIPSQNGPLYILVDQIFSQYHNPAFDYSKNFKMDFLLVPNLSFHVCVYLLSFIFSVLTAYKLCMSAAMILLPVSIFYFIHAVDKRKMLWGFVGFIYIYNYYLFKGYDSFYLSFSLFLFYFGYLIKNARDLKSQNYIVLSVIALLIYFTHIFTFSLTIAVTFFYILVLTRSIPQTIKILFIFIPGLLAFLQYVLTLFSGFGSGVHGSIIRYRMPQATIEEFLYLDMYSFTKWTVLFFLIPMAFLLYMLIKKLKSIYRSDISDHKLNINYVLQIFNKDVMLFMVVLLLIMFFLAPREIVGWPKFNTRFIPFIIFFLLATAGPLPSIKLKRIFLGSVIVSSLATYGLMWHYVVKIDRQFDDYISGISVIEKNKTLLPVDIEEYKVGKVRPLNWAFSYYNIFKGGTTNKVLAYAPGRVPLNYRYSVTERLPSFDPYNPQLTDMEEIYQAYDYVLFWGADDSIFKLFEDAGYSLIHQEGKLTIYSKEQS